MFNYAVLTVNKVSVVLPFEIKKCADWIEQVKSENCDNQIGVLSDSSELWIPATVDGLIHYIICLILFCLCTPSNHKIEEEHVLFLIKLYSITFGNTVIKIRLKQREIWATLASADSFMSFN